jgi:hypothetical protein
MHRARAIVDGDPQARPGAAGRWAGAWDRRSGAVLLLGILLRVALTVVNTYSNDNHLEVIRVMAFEGRVPPREEFEEAFQPKLYHGTVAAIWRLMPGASEEALTLAAHLVSCAAGIVTLVLVARFLRHVGRHPDTRLVALALVSLNPPLVAINAQATNDSFLILFATTALLFGRRFFTAWALRDYLGLAVSTLLAVLSKGNGVVLVPAVMITFAVALVWRLALGGLERVDARRIATYGLLFPLVCVAAWELGPYGEHHRRFGSPFVTNREQSPFPYLFEKTYYRRPGLTSLADGLLTFRFVDLLRHPRNTQGRHQYPLHRTSVWSQVYGRGHSIHFDGWPRPWSTSRPRVQQLTRAILILALLPTALLLAGFARAAVTFVRQAVPGRRERELDAGRLLLDVAALGYVGFVVAYAVLYRDFAVMKAIFMFPGLLGFAALFVSGCDALYDWCAEHPAWRRVAHVTFALLSVCYAADVVLLILRLARLRFF